MKTDLFLVPKMGIIPEVSAQTYGTVARSLREYVSNAVDAGAKNVWLTFTKDPKGRTTLDVRDDGVGMTLEELKDEFLAVGGSKKFGEPTRIGRIGIGFLAIVPLCETILITTKTARAKRAVRAEIQTANMLNQSVRYEEIAKQKVGDADLVDEEQTRSLASSFGESFTVFTLESLHADVQTTFNDSHEHSEFREELRRILPLTWPDDAPLRRHLSKKLWTALKKKAGQHAIDVFVNDTKRPLTRRLYGENEQRETFLYVQEFIDEVIVPFEGGEHWASDEVRVTGFFVCDEPVVGKPAGVKMSGITARFQNVAVQEGWFFGLIGREERKKRVSGELFIEGLNKNLAMIVNRNEFREGYRPVKQLTLAAQSLLQDFFSGMNRVWRARSEINRGIKHVKSVLEGVESALSSIHEVQGDPQEGHHRWKRPSLLQHPQRRTFAHLAEAAEDAGLNLELDEDISADSAAPYRIELKGSPQERIQGRVHVSADLLQVSRQRFSIGGAEYRLRLVSGSDVDLPCALDIGARFVVLNSDHPLIGGADRRTIEFVVYLAYATEMAENPKEMAQMLVRLMMRPGASG